MAVRAVLVLATLLAAGLAGCLAPPLDAPDATPAEGGRVVFAKGPSGLVAHAGDASALFLEGAARLVADGRAWTLRLEGAPRAAPAEGAPTGGVASWFLGADPEAWVVGAPLLDGVAYREAWPGVDVVFHGAGPALKYDVVVAPGADAARARFSVDGALLRVDADGALVAEAAGAALRQPAPFAYQDLPRGRVEVASSFIVAPDARTYGFSLGPHDPTRAVVIDPALESSTYLAGGGVDVAWAVKVGADGSVYVAGESQSPELFPAGTPGERGEMSWTTDHNHEATNVFVAKIRADGSGYNWATFIGGRVTPEPDTAYDLALGADGNVYLAGYTHSWDFPASKDVGNLAFQPALRSAVPTGDVSVSRSHDFYDAFVAKVGGQGGALLHATFLGGTGEDFGYAIGVAPDGDVLVAGETTSLDFPTTEGAFQRNSTNGGDPKKVTWTFVTRFRSFGLALADVEASTIFGGSDHVATYDMEVDGAGRPWFVGYKYVFANPPVTSGAPNDVPVPNGSKNVFVAALDPTLSTLHYHARLGGSDDDRAFGIRVQGGGVGDDPLVWVAGQSASADLNVTGGQAWGGREDAFLLHLDPDAGPGLHKKYLVRIGGRDTDVARAIEVDAQGNAYVVGHTGSHYFYAPRWPTTDGAGGTLPACQAGSAWGQEAIVAKVGPTGQVLYASYLGGAGNDFGEELALAPDGGVVLVGGTQSSDFPTTPGALDAARGAKSDAFVARLRLDQAPDCPATPPELADPCVEWTVPANVTIAPGLPKTLRVKLTNCGRDLNQGEGYPQHFLLYEVYRTYPVPTREFGNAAYDKAIPLGSVPNGTPGEYDVTISVDFCWNGVIEQPVTCDPGDVYEIRWDVMEGHRTDPDFPKTTFHQQGEQYAVTGLKVGV